MKRRLSSNRRLHWIGGALFIAVASMHAAFARLPDQAPPLPPPDGGLTIVNVSTSQQLADACWNLQSNQAIVIAPGTYHLDTVQFPNGVDWRLTVGHFGAAPIQNIQIRGATGNPSDVTILGAGMLDPVVPFGFQVFTATDVTIADLSIGNVYYHALAVQGDQGAQRVRVYHARLFDAGQQIVKGVPGADDVTIEYSELFLTAGAVNHPDGAPPGSCYTNAIDGVTSDRWIVRDNLIHDIWCQDATLAGPAVLLWQGSADTLVERNTILDSSRGIALGLVSADDHLRGIARNNFIRWDADAPYAVDVPIYTTSPDSSVLHNTALTMGRYPNAVEVRYGGATGVVVENNLLDAAIQPRDGATPTESGNLETAVPAWFANIGAGDLHLTANAIPAIDQVTRLSDAVDDFDAQGRPTGTGQADIGADEFGSVDAIFADGFD
ncbi:MAG TPA: hypothetical protein VLK83_04355 [Rhodanobacteraceae bacterium]|nr:hypothetical protein [Rhodanobacteraceae bacterium]